MKKLLLIALLGFNIAQAQSPVNATYARVRDSLTSYTQNTNLLLKGRGTGKIKLNENAYNIVIASDSSLVAVIQRYSDNVTFGTQGQVPYMNAGGTDFIYSSGLDFIAKTLDVDGEVVADTASIGNIRILGNTISSTNTNGDIILDPNGSGDVDFRSSDLDSVNIFTAGSVQILSSGTISSRQQNTLASNRLDIKGGGSVPRISLYGSTYPTLSGNIDFIASDGNTINGRFNGTNWTFHKSVTIGDALTIQDPTNQLVLGTTNTTTINSPAPSANRVYTIDDAGANADILTSIYAGDVDITGSLDVDNININLNTISSTSGNINLEELSGNDIALSSTGITINADQTGDDVEINANTVGGVVYATANNGVVITGASNIMQVDASGVTLTAGQSGDDILLTSADKITFDATGEITFPKLTNQFILGTTNQATINYPEASAAGDITLTLPTVTSTLYGTGSGTITSSEMATSLSDETGSGALVFGTSPTFTTGITTANLTATGTRTFGANGRTIMIDKTVTLTDATATTIATITLPTGSNLAGAYTVKVEGMIINIGTSNAAALGGKRIEASISFGQDVTATSSEGVKTTSSTGTSFGDTLGTRDVSLISVGVNISGTDNSVHALQLNVDAIGSGGAATNFSFVGTITVHYYIFSSFSVN